MHTIAFEIPKPRNEADFELMCKRVYGAVFRDPLPKINGRKGQPQWGVDVFVEDNVSGGRIGVQCKKYCLTQLTFKHVKDEVKAADDKKLPIRLLLIATTAQSDSKLLPEVMKLSDDRKSKGLFDVGVEFWEEIESHIADHPVLQEHYAPNSPGAAYHRQEQSIDVLTSIAIETREEVAALQLLPSARDDSANKIISGLLDRANDLIKTGQYRDALSHVENIGKDLKPFDEHQKARWYLQRGLCLWFSRDDVDEAAGLFLKAAEIYPDDEKMAAAGVRGLMLRKETDKAVAAGKAAAERFPASLQVWLAFANARMVAGEKIRLQDVPSAFSDEPDVLQFAALSAREGGDVAAAADLAERAAAKPTAGFFSRMAYLRFALEHCIQDPVLAQQGLLPIDRLDRLHRAVKTFEPRKEKLWDIQSDAAAETAVHLGFAYLVMGKPESALEVAAEGRVSGIRTGELVRVEMQALASSSREDEALALASDSLDKISPEGMAIAGEMAAHRADPDLVSKIMVAARERFPDNTFAADYLTALRWGAMARAQRREEVLAEILLARPAIDGKLVLRCAASRVYKWAGMLIEATDEALAALQLVEAETSSADRLHVADLLFHLEKWSEAAKLYEGLLANAGNGPSDIHARLLECHVESGNRGKAHSLLSKLSEGWAEHDETRRIAINFGHKVGDWDFLLPLARKSVEKHPVEAWSWLFLLRVVLRKTEPEAFLQELRGIPEDISGTTRNIATLAAMEIKFGETTRGVARLYKLVRSRQDDPEAMSAYLINFMTAKLPQDPPMEVAGEGSFVAFEDFETGAKEIVCIDPAEVGTLPKRDGFCSPGDAEAAPFIGARIGDKTMLPMMAGGERPVKITAIGSAYQRLAAIAHERAGRLQGLPHMRAVHIGKTGDAERDLAKMHEIIKQSSESRGRIVDAYASGGLTISLLGEAMGRSAIEICAGWPSDGPPLFAGAGSAQERKEAMELLARKESILVADSTALAELALFGGLKALDALSKILISTATKEEIHKFSFEVENDESFGTAFDNRGKLGFVEFDERSKRAKVEFAKTLAEVASRCEVAPAYVDIDGEAREFAKMLADEDVETLLLAKDRNAVLLTLDGRLRAVAKLSFGVKGAWPQVLVLYALEAGTISGRDAAEFTAKEFMSNREFVSIRSDDILWMVSQGDWWLQNGFSKLKRYFAAPATDRNSSFAIALEFLRGLGRVYTQVGAFAEILSHLTEAFYKRADHDPSMGEALFDVAKEITLNTAPLEHILGIVNDHRNQQIKLQLAFFARAIVEGRKLAKEDASRPVRIRVLHFAVRPWLVLDKSLSAESNELSTFPRDVGRE